MYCHACGSEIPDVAMFCPRCGAQVSSALAKPAEKPTRSGKKTLLASLLWQLPIIAFSVVGAYVGRLLGVSNETAISVGGAVGAVCALVGLGGISLLAPRKDALVAWTRKGAWLYVVSVGFMAFDLVASFLDPSFVVAPDWPLRVVDALVMCLAIGVMEEGTFRGVMLGGALAAFGRTKRGVVTVCVATSVLFGLAHVVGTPIDGDPLLLLQAVLKVVQTGIFGFFLAAMTVRTDNMLGGVLLHGISDFLLVLPTLGIAGETLDPTYVSSGSAGMSNVSIYLFAIVLYLPLLLQGIRAMKEATAPCYGAFGRDEGRPKAS